MPRVHTKKAAKDYPAHGIKKGDTYYTWSTRTTVGKSFIKRVHRSATYPKQSQLTSSAFDQGRYSAEEALAVATEPDEFRSIASDVESLGDEQQEKFDNMPDGLQQGDTGQMLEERATACSDWKDAIESAADELETKLSDIDEEEEEFKSAAKEWEAYDAAYADWDADEDPDGEPDEPDSCRPEKDADDFQQEREDAIQEARDASDYPG